MVSSSSPSPGAWTPTSWRTRPVAQSVSYPSASHLSNTLHRLSTLPGLVTPHSIHSLSTHLTSVAAGRAFLLQAGDCAELFADCREDKIAAKLRLILMMSLVIVWGARMPVVRVGRIAGQYGKPRSKDKEMVEMESGEKREVLTFRGDNVNGFSPSDRTPDPERLLQAYFHSSATLNHIHGLLSSGFADLHAPLDFSFDHVRDEALKRDYRQIVESITDSLDFMGTIGADPSSAGGSSSSSLSSVDYYTSHEGLILEYEESLTRLHTSPSSHSSSSSRAPPAGCYNLSAHMLWLGDRTRDLNGAHVEYFRGIKNPIGIKVGPSMQPEELVRLLEIVDPDVTPGRVTLIGRFGASKIESHLPPLIRAVQSSRHASSIIWISDPMHGNTISPPSHPDIKTRLFTSIVSELSASFRIHASLGSRLSGAHLELTGEVDESGQSVTECMGGSMELGEEMLRERYLTHCDPRLNAEQGLDVAFLVSRELRERRLQGSRKPSPSRRA